MSIEGERLAAVEVKIIALQESYLRLQHQIEAANDKLDQIVATIEQGRGALWLLLKLGAAVIALVAAANWVMNHVKL